MAGIHLPSRFVYGLLLLLVLLSVASLILFFNAAGQLLDPGSFRIKTGSEALDLWVFGRIGASVEVIDTEKTALYPDDPHLNLVDLYA